MQCSAVQCSRPSQADLSTRAVDGLMSTGLRRGSFASDEINPLDVTEMLRPEVYLLWTMRTVQYSAVQCSAVPAGERGGDHRV